ncbi:TRAP transporter substrate-binding protein DctP [uncultured Oscillibacter sp.]|uniref:TRAP transporter substrate-binding protein n=1 Tax=uncultured Oscillibacter sp. TaxID=876091 RepID=UPI002804581D|nr:TRAP transporter substrate-binding protein DctP [uncultured Oscillibacter sp.]
MKKAMSMVLALMMILSLAACGGKQEENPAPAPDASGQQTTQQPAADPITLRYASVYTQSSSYGQAMEKFKALVEEKSNGGIIIDCYYDAVLGAESEMIQSQKDGGIEIAFSAASGIGLYVEATQILEAWYAYEDVEGVKSLFESIMDQLDAEYQKAGFKLIGAYYDGYRNILAKKPITSLADMKGLKMRSPTNAMFSGCIEALGAQAVAMPLGDVYTSLQTGAIEACEGTLDTLYNNKFYEQANCLIWDSHTWTPMSITMNLDSWNALTADQQTILMEASQEASDYQVQLFQNLADKQLEEMKAAGLTIYEITDRADWIAAVEPVVSSLAKEYGDLGVQIYEAQKAAQ